MYGTKKHNSSINAAKEKNSQQMAAIIKAVKLPGHCAAWRYLHGLVKRARSIPNLPMYLRKQPV